MIPISTDEEVNKELIRLINQMKIQSEVGPKRQVYRDPPKKEERKADVTDVEKDLLLYFKRKKIPKLLDYLLRTILTQRPEDPLGVMQKLCYDFFLFRSGHIKPPVISQKNHLKFTFRAFDPGGTGFISEAQFNKMLEATGSTWTLAELPLNENGMITEEDFYNAYCTIREKHVLDFCGDGSEDKKEKNLLTCGPKILTKNKEAEEGWPRAEWVVEGEGGKVRVVKPDALLKTRRLPAGLPAFALPRTRNAIFDPPPSNPSFMEIRRTDVL